MTLVRFGYEMRITTYSCTLMWEATRLVGLLGLWCLGLIYALYNPAHHLLAVVPEVLAQDKIPVPLFVAYFAALATVAGWAILGALFAAVFVRALLQIRRKGTAVLRSRNA